MYKATTSTERLFRGDVCRLGECPDFRVSISTSSEVNMEDDVINALQILDMKCRNKHLRGDELTRSLQNVELPCGWKLQATTCRDEVVWMDPDEKVEVNVSKIFEVTGVSKPTIFRSGFPQNKLAIRFEEGMMMRGSTWKNFCQQCKCSMMHCDLRWLAAFRPFEPNYHFH